MENKELVVRNPESLLLFLAELDKKDTAEKLYCVAYHTKEGQVELNFYTDSDNAEAKSQIGELLVGLETLTKVMDYKIDIKHIRSISLEPARRYE